jgi:hypothetical protein
MFHTAVIIIAIALLPIAIVVVLLGLGVVVFGLGVALTLAIPVALLYWAWIAIEPPIVTTVKSSPAYSMPHAGMICKGKMWLNDDLKQYQCSEAWQEADASPQDVKSKAR